MTGIVFGCAVPHPPVMVPEIGRGQEREITATIEAMKKLSVRLAECHPDILLVISPHGISFPNAMGVATSNFSEGNFEMWGVRGLNFHFENDLQFVTHLEQEAKRANIPLGSIGEKSYSLDHGVLVPIYFLISGVKGVSLVPLTFSWLPLSTHFSFGQVIRRAAERTEKKVALIASGDLSHRLLPGAPAGYDAMGKIFDEKLVDAISRLDSEAILNLDPELIERAGECGLRSFVILLGALSGLPVTPEVLSYQGPFGVGYMVASFEVGNLAPER